MWSRPRCPTALTPANVHEAGSLTFLRQRPAHFLREGGVQTSGVVCKQLSHASPCFNHQKHLLRCPAGWLLPSPPVHAPKVWKERANVRKCLGRREVHLWNHSLKRVINQSLECLNTGRHESGARGRCHASMRTVVFGFRCLALGPH